jgi:5-methylcytosine-specific restriction endonuclease McrA
MSGPRNINVEIREMLKAGIKPVDISKHFKCAQSTVTYHAKRLGQEIIVRPTYDWKEVNNFYTVGHTLVECMEKFGFCRASWHKAKLRGVVVPRVLSDHIIPLDVLLAPGRKETSRSHVKYRLLKAGLLKKKCYLCGVVKWRGKPLAFNLDHADGNKFNWSLTNLRMVCPNCDSQQETFAGRNVGRLAKLANDKNDLIAKSSNRKDAIL